MRILIAHNRYRSAAPSGENRVVDTEGEALAARGHEVIRFERRSDDIEGWSPARKASLPARAVWNPEAQRDLRSVLAATRPHVVHLHNTFPLLSPAVLQACRQAGVPVVATLHNYKLACANGEFYRDGAVCHDCAEGRPGQAVRHGCYRGSRVATVPVVLAGRVHRSTWRSLVSAYIFISGSQRDLLSGVGLPPERVFVRHNLIPHRPVPAQPRTSTVVYAGRLDPAKGARLLMAAWDRYLARTNQPGLRLVIAGGGPLAGEVAAWAASRPSVELTGQVSRDRCAELVAAARAVLLPSTWEETFGLVAVEAMAAGTAPIASAHGSFPELITADVDGVLFTPGDPESLALAIGDADTHPERYETLGEQARKTYEARFDPSANLEQLLGIYRFAIAHPR
ncbi:MAG: glycosyltransferase [Actinobacteria bacterium]|nr:glycosyltransferase [Actinomycetota bacterium]